MVAKSDSVIYIEGHRKWYIAGFVLSVVLYAVSTYIALRHPITSWEYKWLTTINNWPGSWHKLFYVIVAAGGSMWTAVFAVLVTFIIKLYRLTLRIAVEVVLLSILVFITHHFVNRPPPLVTVAGIHARAAESGFSYPAPSVAIAAVVALSILPYLSFSWKLMLPLWVLLVAIAELYLGVRTPIDILGGIGIGLFTVSLVRIIPQSLKVFLRLD